MARRFLAKIYVTLKPTVNDPQGLTVRGGLHNLGQSGVIDVRVGKYIEVLLEASDAEEAGTRAKEMCHTLLANPVIELFRYELEEKSEPTPGG